MNNTAFCLTLLFSTALMGHAFAQDEIPPLDRKVTYSPYPTQNFPNRVFFGDTHLHTSYSTDAGLVGATLGPEEAYRFARGEQVTSSTGLPAKLARPLDFLVVADHAENLGLAPMIAESDPGLLKSEWGKKVHDLAKTGTIEGQGAAFNMWIAAMQALEDPFKGQEKTMAQPAWRRITAAAEKYNEPGRFTAIIGYEWTSGPDGNNLHRNVIFRNGKDKADIIIPLSYYDTGDPEDLWKWMAEYEKKTGGKMLAIAHNGNLSNGLMFDDVTLTSKQPLDRDYRMYTHAVRDGVDFNVASIPDDFTEVSQSAFDQDYMTKLYKRGYETAISGTAWQKTPPDYVQ